MTFYEINLNFYFSSNSSNETICISDVSDELLCLEEPRKSSPNEHQIDPKSNITNKPFLAEVHEGEDDDDLIVCDDDDELIQAIDFNDKLLKVNSDENLNLSVDNSNRLIKIQQKCEIRPPLASQSESFDQFYSITAEVYKVIKSSWEYFLFCLWFISIFFYCYYFLFFMIL